MASLGVAYTAEKNTLSQNKDDLYLQQWYQELLTLQKGLIKDDSLKDQRLSYLLDIRETLIKLDSHIIENHKNEMEKIINLLLDIAYFFCDWPLVIFTQEKIFPLTNKKIEANLTQLIDLSDAYCQMGEYFYAKQKIETLLLAMPKNLLLDQQWKNIDQHLEKNKENLSFLVDEELSLIFLEKKHLRDFSWQYSSSIMNLCNLPNFTTDNDWYLWLDAVTRPHDSDEIRQQTVAFSVIHQEWGFIGSVHLKVINGVGFYYYWLGEDFQGQGFGPRAVNLLLHYGFSYMGMSCCYAKVYQHNEASHKAIKKIGFTALPFKAAAPYDNEVFYYMGYEKNNEDQFTELKALIEQLDDFLEVLPSQCIRPT